MPERKNLWGIIRTALALPRRGIPTEEEIFAAQERADKKVMDILVNISSRFIEPPEIVHVMVREDTGLVFGAYVRLEQQEGSKNIVFHDLQRGILKESVGIVQKVDRLIKDHPEMPLWCDESICQVLLKDPGTTLWVEEKKDQHWILSRGTGMLEVFTPIRSADTPPGYLPPNFIGGQFFV